jgi:hypothetical protein
MTVATAKAHGTRGARYARSGRVRIVATIDEPVFDDLKRCAIRNHRSIAEEMRLRLRITARNESTDTVGAR